MKKPLPLVAVQWSDAYVTTSTQFEAHEIPHTPIIVTTYGLLLREDATGVSVASESVAEGAGSYRGVTFIPRGMILTVRHLATPRRTTPRTTKPTPEAAPCL